MKKSFKDLLQSSETPVLVDFYADWCGPCKMMSPILKEFAQEQKGKLKIIKIDVDKNPEIAQKMRIQGIPTLVLFDQAEVKWRKSGALPKAALKQELQGFLD